MKLEVIPSTIRTGLASAFFLLSSIARADLFVLPEAMPLVSPKPGSHTFIFYVHGAADHFVPASLDDLNRWENADEVDVQRLGHLSEVCTDCNTVLLHLRRKNRGAAPRLPETELKVYIHNQLVISRASEALFAGDPHTFSDLLRFSNQLFPGVGFHFIYRGHSLYDTSGGVQTLFQVPFDLNFPQRPFGFENFIEGLAHCGFARPCASMTFAACTMDHPEVRQSLQRYAHRVIATDQRVNETLDQGFDYSFLMEVSPQDSEDEVADKIERGVFKRLLPHLGQKKQPE